MTTTQLNEGYLDLNPDPSDEAGDMLDGVIAVTGPLRLRRVPSAEPVGRRVFAALPPWVELVDAVFAGQGKSRTRNLRR